MSLDIGTLDIGHDNDRRSLYNAHLYLVKHTTSFDVSTVTDQHTFQYCQNHQERKLGPNDYSL